MATTSKECPFCRIIDGSDAEAQVVGEAEGWVAFFPLQPATRGHTLVVPRTHIRNFWTADPSTAANLAIGCIEVGRALETVLAPEGMNLITSAGEAAEQTVFHLHLHVVPRWRTDAIDCIWPSPGDSVGRATDDLADELRRALGSVRGD